MKRYFNNSLLIITLILGLEIETLKARGYSPPNLNSDHTLLETSELNPFDLNPKKYPIEINYHQIIAQTTPESRPSTFTMISFPKTFFETYLKQIQEQLPANLIIRFPQKIGLSYADNTEVSQYQLEILKDELSQRITVNLLNCPKTDQSCLVGSFIIDSINSEIAQQLFKEHQAGAAPITLRSDVQGYFIDGSLQKTPSPFSSVMWEQDGQFYTIIFPVKERQNILYMAYSMANSQPIGNNITDSIQKTNSEINSNTTTRSTGITETPTTSGSESSQILTPEDNTIRIPVKEIKVIGNTVIPESEITQITQSFIGKDLSLTELNTIADRITQLYIDQGYINSRAKISGQIVKDGIVEINIIEGKIVDIEIRGNQRLNTSYIRNRVQLGITEPLNSSKLEEQLRLLRFNPLLETVEAELKPTGELGESILIVNVTEAKSLIAGFSVDNYSPISVGSERLGFNLGYQNLTGIGDRLLASYYVTTTAGSNQFDFNYQIPLNARDGTLTLRVAPEFTEITQPPFNQLNIESDKELYEISFRQPIIRSLEQELGLSLGFTFQEVQTSILGEPTPFGIGPDEDGISRTSVINFSQDYVRRDPQGAWSLRSQFSFGTGLFDATSNEGSIPDGYFFSWLGQIQRVQRLGDNQLLIIQGDLQLTPNSLLPVYQFVIGGGQSVRGYRQNARSGDNGLRFSIEDRIALVKNESGFPTLQIAPFLDLGTVWNNDDNPNEISSQNFLAGVGLGLILQDIFSLEGLDLRLDYGVPLINLDDRGNNAQDEGFYFNLSYNY